MLVLAVAVTAVVGRSSGAPQAACSTITPGHGFMAQTGPVPFIVNISSLDSGYIPEQTYTSEYRTINIHINYSHIATYMHTLH